MAGSQSHAPVIVFKQTIEEAFPKVDPNFEPFGSRVLVQLKVAKTKTESGIVLPNEAQDTIQANTQVAKVISHGPLAFHNRTTMEPWPEGSWSKPGSYIRIPKFGGDTFEVKVHEEGKSSRDDYVVMFKVFNDLDLLGAVPDPLNVIVYI
jgi:co-chaperonin GroES (HSP10)